MYSVLIIDDDQQWSKVLALSVNDQEDFSVIAEAKNGKEGILLIDYYRPQIIILDIVMPEYDGMRVLRYISEVADYTPYIYVLTGHGTDSIVNMLNDINVDRYDLKPIDIDSVIRNMRDMLLFTKRTLNIAESSSMEMSNLIESTLLQVGVPINLIGFLYLKTSMQCCLDDETYLFEITKRLYPQVAQICGQTVSAVERSIRTVVTLCKKSRTELYRQIFEQTHTRKMTNTIFLITLAKYIKRIGGTANSNLHERSV